MTRRRAWWWLALLLGITAVFSVTWANWSWTYTHDRFAQLPPGASAKAYDGTELRVLSIKESPPGSVGDGLDGDLPDGVVQIEVLMEARLLGPTPDSAVYCKHPLVAEGLQWEPSYAHFEDDRVEECDADEERLGAQWRQFTTAYRVPERYVDRINGIAIFHFDGTKADVVRP